MPYRKTPLVEGQYYHIFNRGVNKQPIFLDSRDYARAIELIKFYQFANQTIKYSRFKNFALTQREKIWDNLLTTNDRLIGIVAFCLMPNHFHFLLKQLQNNGISRFVAHWQDSFSRYFNTKHERIGPLVQGQFKAVRVENDSQLLHLSRYIHLNPLDSYLVKDMGALRQYPWSSLREYLGGTDQNICDKEIVLKQFKKPSDYERFVSDFSDYQKKIKTVDHLTFEE
ncbi:MAG: transposase [Patescibacteria group bacterium]